MASINKKKTEANLLKKGFSYSPGDHRFLEFHHNGTMYFHTKISHGSNSKEIDNYLISKMASQCKLSKDEFLNLARCPLKKEQYLKILSSKDIL